MRRRFSIQATLVAIIALAWGGAGEAWAQSDRQALWSDPAAIRAALRGQEPGDSLLDGLLAAYELRDEEATRVLSDFLDRSSGDPAARDIAAGALGLVLLRQGRYAEAADRLGDAVDALAGDEEDRRDLEQTRAVAHALRESPPQRRSAYSPGSIPVTRDAAGLPRVPLTVNGEARDYVFDTGANLSVVTESEAQALGLRIVGETAGVGSTTQQSTPAHIGVAREATIGEVRFENVVFLVLPDDSLSFAGGAYRIPGILGFPLLSHLERLTVSGTVGAGETLAWTLGGPAATVRDLFVDGLTPNVYVRVEDGPPVIFAFDTGANRTTLRPELAIDQPELMAGAVERTERVGGAGGETTLTVRRLPSVRLRIDDLIVPLSDVSVTDEEAGGDAIRGRLGQDVLAGGYVIDFRAGDFALSPTP